MKMWSTTFISFEPCLDCSNRVEESTNNSYSCGDRSSYLSNPSKMKKATTSSKYRKKLDTSWILFCGFVFATSFLFGYANAQKGKEGGKEATDMLFMKFILPLKTVA